MIVAASFAAVVFASGLIFASLARALTSPAVTSQTGGH